MNQLISYENARDLLLKLAAPMGTEQIPLAQCSGRILAQDLVAKENVPPFDRSPYDGYAFRSADSTDASRENPVTLRILEEIPAGGVSHFPVEEGCAVKILTGAPISPGADAVVMFEKTEHTEQTVTLFEPSASGSNIIYTGEDIRAGEILAQAGTVIDPGLMGSLAAQNVPEPTVFRVPKIGILSNGSELLDVGDPYEPGKIYNSNQYMLSTALSQLGCEPVILGSAVDRTEQICAYILQGLDQCDALILTGGVSVGDYDLTPAAMEMAGVEILFRGVDVKPGMACAYGVKDGKLICGLSGNPASSLTNFYAVACPAIKKICGHRNFLPKEFSVKIAREFPKKGKVTRLLRGRLDLTDGEVRMQLASTQGNVILSSTIGCDCMAIIPAGMGPIPAGASLKAFMI